MLRTARGRRRARHAEHDFTLVVSAISAVSWMAIALWPTPARAEDNKPASGAPTDGAPRPADPGAPPPEGPNAPPTAAPLPPLPPAGPTQPPLAEAPPPPPPPPPQEHPRRLWFGGLGYAMVGPFFGDLSTLDAALRADEALGASYGIGRAAFTLGGGGAAILGGHLWIGGKGFGLLTAPFVNVRGEAILGGGGGGGEIGYVIARPRMLIVPYFGFGGFGYNLRVANRSGRPMPLEGGLALAPGESRHFKSGFLTAEFGVKVQRLLFSGRGGFMGGFELGVIRSLSAAPWKSEPYEFVDHAGAVIDGVYVRVTFGGGGGITR